MRHRWLVLIALPLAAWAGCAKGTSSTETGGVGGDTTSSGSSTSSGASSSSSTTTSSSSTTTSSSTSSSSSSSSGASSSSSSSGAGGAGPCSEMPCKLVEPQCGCPAGKACTIKNPASGRVCATAGVAAVGAVCTGAMDCAAGAICIQTSKTVSTCAKYCDSDAECTAPGGLCVRTLNDGMGGSIAGVAMCSENCNPMTNTGCPVAGTSCQLGQEAAGQMRFFTFCTGSSNGGKGTPCMTAAECAPELGCFNTGMATACLKYCDVNAPACPGGQTCAQLQDKNMQPITIGNWTFGVCQ